MRELLVHPRLTARSLLATPAALASLGDLLGDRARGALPVYVAPSSVLKQVTGFRVHRGCLALGERPPPATDADLPALAAARLVVVLEQVGNPDNVGSIFRNAAAFGAGAVLLGPGCCDPLYRKAIRTSIGATLRIPWGAVAGLARRTAPAAGARLRDGGPGPGPRRGPLPALAADPPPRTALVFGSEGAGLSDAAAAGVDRRVRDPDGRRGRLAQRGRRGRHRPVRAVGRARTGAGPRTAMTGRPAARRGRRHLGTRRSRTPPRGRAATIGRLALAIVDADDRVATAAVVLEEFERLHELLERNQAVDPRPDRAGREEAEDLGDVALVPVRMVGRPAGPDAAPSPPPA